MTTHVYDHRNLFQRGDDVYVTDIDRKEWLGKVVVQDNIGITIATDDPRRDWRVLTFPWQSIFRVRSTSEAARR